MTVVPSRPLPPGIPPDWRESRRVFEEATRGLRCGDLLHVNSPTCCGASLDMLGACILGAAKYFIPFYMVHIIWNGRKALAGDKAFYKQLAYYYVRSIIFGAAMGSMFAVTGCVMVRLTRGFSFWTSLLVPGTFAGLSIFIEHVYRRRIVMNTFYNLALHYLYVRAQLAGVVRRTAAGETAVFMLINALLLCLLHRARGQRGRAGGAQQETSGTVFWFFIPETEGKRSGTTGRRCLVPHKDTCLVSAFKATAKYSALAATLQVIRVLMSRGGTIVKRPSLFFSDLLSLRSVAGICSIGGYVSLYKVARCALAQHYGSDRSLHSALAGLVAGTAYWLQPNTTILTSALIATLRLLHDYMPKKLRPLGEWPVPELLFALCNGILIHARCMDMAHCPRFILHMVDSATQNRSKAMYNAYLQHVNKLHLSVS